MSTQGTSDSSGMTPQETVAILQRILQAVEKDERTRWAQITCAVVLSLATTASAWCAYQATLWSGVQTFRLAAAAKAGRQSSTARIEALQLRAFDAAVGISYIQAKFEGNQRQEKFLYDRFRPEFKKAVDAWLKTDPLNNPAAPLGPMKMPEYVQPELAEADRHDEQFALEHASAQKANQNSDTYVLLTVMFASVLFFGGIAGTLESHRMRITILALAVAFFVVTLAVLVTMPICTE
jgi:hypothetical protein